LHQVGLTISVNETFMLPSYPVSLWSLLSLAPYTVLCWQA